MGIVEGSLLLFTLFISLGIFWYSWRRRRFFYFKELGIPGPTPNFIDGNIKEISEKGIGTCQIEWTKKYGRICGYFLGSRPVLLVSDPELLNIVMVKQHSNFTSREWFLEDGGVPVAAFRKAGVAIVRGNKWKELRDVLSPTFTSRRIKEMVPLIDKTVQEFIIDIEEKAKLGEPVSMNNLYHRLAFDSTVRTAFGMEPQRKEKKNAFMEDINKLFSVGVDDFIIYLCICFQEFSPIFLALREVLDRISYYLGRPSCLGAFMTCKKLLKCREAGTYTGRKDFIQLVLEAREHGRQLSESSNYQGSSSWRISNEEIVANMVNFAVAGYDTIANILVFATYEIVKQPEIQEKLRREIQELENDKKLEGIIYGIPYLDQVLAETLRKYAIIPNLTNRSAEEQYRYRTLRLPKGLTIQASVTYLHNDPEFWTNPEQFDPTRFSKCNKPNINPMTYLPFGRGPRNCIGMRFAQIIMRDALAELLTKYELQQCNKTKPLTVGNELIVLRPNDDLVIRAIPLKS